MAHYITSARVIALLADESKRSLLIAYKQSTMAKQTLAQKYFGEEYAGIDIVLRTVSEQLGIWIDFNNAKKYARVIVGEMQRVLMIPFCETVVIFEEVFDTLFWDPYMAMAEHLGWDEIPASVAIDAIQQIINNHMACVADATGYLETEEQATACLLGMDSDKVFGYLICDEIQMLGSEDEHLFISLREEIEDCMRSGMSHADAIAEWYK